VGGALLKNCPNSNKLALDQRGGLPERRGLKTHNVSRAKVFFLDRPPRALRQGLRYKGGTEIKAQ